MRSRRGWLAVGVCLLALLAKEGLSAKERTWLAQRGIYKKVEELPDGGKVVELKRSPPAWWAAFVLCGDPR